jgi:hypothetical protein
MAEAVGVGLCADAQGFARLVQLMGGGVDTKVAPRLAACQKHLGMFRNELRGLGLCLRDGRSENEQYD